MRARGWASECLRLCARVCVRLRASVCVRARVYVYESVKVVWVSASASESV